jgi:subtilisin family serine protease
MTKYNVVFDKSLDIEQFKTALEQAGAVIYFVFPKLGVMNVSASTLDFSAVSGVLSYEEDLDITPEESFEWHQLRVTSGTLPMRNWYLPKNLGDGVNVYVVDSGIDSTHSEFSHTTINNLYSHNNDFTPSNGHGTGVASLIGGKTLGVSPNVLLHNVIVPTGASTTISVLLGAFDAIATNHDSTKIGVVNCSWTIPKSQILDSKITELQSLNLVVVASAGNIMQAADDFSPVGLNSVLGVGASDAYDRVISWGAGAGSNWGPEVDVFAPGIDVTCADMVSGGTVSASGTSLAAGVVSGVVAQFIATDPTSTAADIHNYVLAIAVRDLLFRNESIYGTTPNAIVHAPNTATLFLNVPSKGIECQIGTTSEFSLAYNPDIVGSLSVDFVRGVIHYCPPEWITFANDTLTVTPPENFPSGMYHVFILVNNPAGEYIMKYRLSINIYQTSPAENENFTESYFFEMQENAEVVVTLASCSTGSCSSPFGFCQGDPPKNAFCVCNQFSVCTTSRTN